MSRELPSAVPPDLAIRVIHSDEDVVVIIKPCNLRSVPGHAKQPPPPAPPSPPALLAPSSAGRKRPRDGSGVVSSGGVSSGGDGSEGKDDVVVDGVDSSESERDKGLGTPLTPSSRSHRRTAQEAWVEAIKSFGSACAEDGGGPKGNAYGDNESKRALSSDALSILRSLASSDRSLSSVPRKPKPFARYCCRNHRRLLGGKDGPDSTGGKWKVDSDASTFENAAKEAHGMIRARQIPLLNLPEGTRDEESAWGQLKLMGYGGSGAEFGNVSSSSSSLRIVHRLDCETSGVMVFALNEDAASALSRAWRDRDQVKKLYMARVARWPPYQEAGTTEGTIDLPLAKAKERLKWEVRDLEKGGKESKTFWRICTENVACESLPGGGEAGDDKKETDQQQAPITLALTPLTGRTHQLRVHCATVGSGIEGDSLYGAATAGGTVWNPKAAADTADGKATTTLKLHAHKLSFPHPRSGKLVEFEAPIPWP